MTLRRALLILTALACFFVLGGCSMIGVEPWERELLARDAMQIDGDDFDRSIDDHIYFSREASSGGRAFGGGGCGCN